MNNVGTKTLETKRLILRKFNMSDASEVFNNWTSDRKTTLFLGWSAHKSISETERIIKIWLDEYDQMSYNWNIVLKENNHSIGNISVINYNQLQETRNAYMYYCLGSSYWNCGYAYEALEKVIEFLINEVGVDEISAGYDSLNTNSGRLLKKCGFVKIKEIPNEGLNPQTGKYTETRIEYSLQIKKLKKYTKQKENSL